MENVEELKVCKKCLQSKVSDLFYTNRAKCIECYLKSKRKTKVIRTSITCKTCQQTLPVNNFYKKRNVCKSCFVNHYCKKYRESLHCSSSHEVHA